MATRGGGVAVSGSPLSSRSALYGEGIAVIPATAGLPSVNRTKTARGSVSCPSVTQTTRSDADTTRLASGRRGSTERSFRKVSYVSTRTTAGFHRVRK